MKKSIFLFFAAILCAIGMNAAVPSKLYLDASEWGYSDARYAAYFMPQNSFVDMTKATGEVSVFEVAVPASQTEVIFVRMNGATTENNWNSGTKWNQTGDLTIPTDGKNKFKPSGWDGATTTWSTYTYTPPTFYIAGDFVTPNWDPAAAANKMDYADGVFSKSYNDVAASAHQFKITDGDWGGAIGYNQNTCSGTNCTVEGNGENIQFTPLAEGTVTITYTIADGKVHITCPEPPAAEFNITYPATQANYTLVAGPAKAQAGTEVSFTATPAEGYVLNVTYNGNAITGNNNVYAFMMPAADVTIAIEAVAATTLYYVDHNSWGNANAYMWNDSGNNGWPGAAMALVGTVGDNAYSYYSISFAQGAYTSIIFNGGGSQTADLTINTAEPYFYDGEWYTWDDLLAKLAAPVVTYDYYITGSFNGDNPKKAENGMTLDGEVYKATVTLAEGDNTLKVTDGSWDNTWGYSNLGAAYDEVSDANDYNNIKITLAAEAEKNITVIFDATAGKITFEGLTEKAPAEPVTVYFINSGNWDKVACYYWGGIEASTWPGAEMTANGEVYEAEGWNVYAITFPGDNTKCIFTDKKAEGATQTADLTVENGKYYCYANGIWYERLADVDLLDTRVYLKGQMNEWCANYCDMFRKETVDGTVVYRTVYLEEASTTYEFKIESAGTWLSNTGTMTKDNCTGWTFEESVSDNAKITTEYAGDYIFTWDMTTNKLSVEYPDPKANPEEMDLMVTDMVFDEDAMSFIGTDNMMMGIKFTLVLGDDLGDGEFALAATSTVNFEGTLFTEVTGTIAPDTETFASASAVVKGFYMGRYYQLNVEMSAGGSAASEQVYIYDGVATVNGAGELTISATWEGDDIYVMAPGFTGESYECDEVWFYVGGTTWETASIIAFGPASIEVDGSTVLVSGTVMSGMTGAQYELFVFGELPVEETPDYTRPVELNQWGTICLPNASSSFTGATFYEVSSLDPAKGLWLDQLADGAQLVAGKPYIFYATAAEITVTYTDAAPVPNPVAGENGLTGTFTGIAAGDLTGNYIIAENKVWVAGASATLPANRAYIANTVPTTEQPQLPGRRRVCMGENATTGLDQIVAPEGQAVKAIENGQLIIIRDGVKYNVQGQKL